MIVSKGTFPTIACLKITFRIIDHKANIIDGVKGDARGIDELTKLIWGYPSSLHSPQQ